MHQRTLVIIKPDAVAKGDVDMIKERYRDAGLKIVRERAHRMNQRIARALYEAHKGKFFFEGLVLAMISGPSVMLELQGEDAIRVVRNLNGATDPAKAEAGTIRRDFRSAGGPFNTVHGSDSPEAAAREIIVVFED
ncbi:MAG TPA: nucleoside-diphosphate kinase [Candidatus Paceibacterota bacterium]|nr:nucleoside-diphosphate kinase [Candidatus Paceibacterota bacterium]